MDAEERRALEEELAAELAGLVDEDEDGGEDFDDEASSLKPGGSERQRQHEPGVVAPVSEYVRLDLDELLRQVANSDQDTQQQQPHQQPLTSDGNASSPPTSTPSSWGLLLASAEKCDEEFFAFIRQDLDDLQTTILSPFSTILIESPASVPVCSSATNPIEADICQQSDSVNSSSVLPPASSSRNTENGSRIPEIGCNVDRIDEHAPISRQELEREPHFGEEASSRDHHMPCLPDATLLSSSPLQCTETTSEERNAPTATAAEDQLPTISKTSRKSESLSPLVEAGSSNATPAHSIFPFADASTRDQELQLISQETQFQMKLIEKQHLARQRLLQKTQERRQQEQEKITRQMQEMEKRFAEEEEVQKAHKLEQQQAKECVAMQKEEFLVRNCIAATHRARETKLMTREERIPRVYHDLRRDELRKQQRELSAMATEEAFEWKRLKLEAEKQRKERLMEEKCVLRRRFNTVMFQLVASHETKAAKRKKLYDAARKREARELSSMRSEELSQHRISAQRRALLEEQIRLREREAMVKEDVFAKTWAMEMHRQMTQERLEMGNEDALAREIRGVAEKRKQDMNRLLMAKEEELSRIAQVAEFQRQHLNVKRHEACRKILMHRKRVAYLGIALSKWRCAVARDVDAALQIQRRYRAYTLQRRIRWLNDPGLPTETEYAEEASAAAMVVQSMFRGFTIRRKFANALEMAKLVGDGDELEFGEVNLDDLIQMPPELEDGWENPVLPASRQHRHQHFSVPQANDVDECEDADNEEGPESGDYEDEPRERDEDYYQRAPVDGNYSGEPVSNTTGCYGGGGNQASNIVTQAPSTRNEQLSPQQDPAPPAAPAPPANLASTLWDKMRKMKQKQRHAAEERSREQDPTYRLQKIMKKNQSSSRTSNNNTITQVHGSSTTTAPHVPPAMISWGSSNGSGEKKKPKVKLPSLVERLRKKTEAAR